MGTGCLTMMVRTPFFVTTARRLDWELALGFRVLVNASTFIRTNLPNCS